VRSFLHSNLPQTQAEPDLRKNVPRIRENLFLNCKIVETNFWETLRTIRITKAPYIEYRSSQLLVFFVWPNERSRSIRILEKLDCDCFAQTTKVALKGTKR
jgi:hypothetical protein